MNRLDEVRALCSEMLDTDGLVLTNEQHKEALDDFQEGIRALFQDFPEDEEIKDGIEDVVSKAGSHE